MVAEIDVKDQDGYTRDFLPKAQANITEMGGKYLGGGFNKAIAFAGAKPPNRVVLLQFPDMDAVKALYDKEGRPASAPSGSRASSKSDNAKAAGCASGPPLVAFLIVICGGAVALLTEAEQHVGSKYVDQVLDVGVVMNWN